MIHFFKYIFCNLSAQEEDLQIVILRMSSSVLNDDLEETKAIQSNDFEVKVESVGIANGKEDLTLKVDNINRPTDRLTSSPDGGWGWVVVFAAMMVTTVIGGSYIAFAILYIEFVEVFHTTRLAAGWIGSLAIGCGNILGIFFGGFVKRYGSRIACIVGAMITATGYVASAFSTDIVHLYLAYGIVSGIGVSMMIVSSLVIVMQYFDKRRPTAVALAVFGYSLGALIGGPFAQMLLDRYAWRGTLIIIGGIFLQTIVCAFLFRPPVLNQSSRQREQNPESVAAMDLDAHAEKRSHDCLSKLRNFLSSTVHMLGFTLLRYPPFLLYMVSGFCLSLGITVFLQHTPSRAVSLGIERHKAALLSTIMGATTGISRVALGFVANVPGVNRLLQYSFSAVVSGAIQAATGFAKSFPMIAVFVVLESISNGGFYCVQSTVIVDINGIENAARSQALLGFSSGLGILVSIPFAGFLFDITNNYDIPFLVTGCIALLGGLLGLVANLWLKKMKTAAIK